MGGKDPPPPIHAGCTARLPMSITDVSSEESNSGELGRSEEELLLAAKKAKEAADRKLQEQLEVVKEGLGGTSGETLLASVAAQVETKQFKRKNILPDRPMRGL